VTAPRSSRVGIGEIALAAPLLLALALAALLVADILSYRGATALGAFVGEALLSPVGVRSLLAALVAGVLAALWGLAPGALLASRPRGFVLSLCAAWLAGMALPPVFLGGVWSWLLGMGPAPARSDESDLLRWLALSLTWGLSLAPLASLAVMLALVRVPRGELAAASIYLDQWQRFCIVLWPRVRGGLALASCAAAGLALLDASTPAHFGVTTVASRAQIEFLSTLETAPAGAVILAPWLAISTLAWGLAPRDQGPSRAVFLTRAPCSAVIAGSLAVALSVGVPAVTLAWMAGNAAHPSELAHHLPETLHSLKCALLGGTAAAFMALLYLALDARELLPRRGVLAAGGALLLIAPGMLAGYATLWLGLRTGAPVTAWWCGFVLRTAPWCVPLILWSGGNSSLRAAMALGLPARRRVLAALLDRGPVVGALAFFAGAAGALREIEYFAAFSLPGGETLSARAAQLLHFGMRPSLSALMLIQLLLAVAWSFGMSLIARRFGG
jgi:ABC-type Fe3+ transport system permease subunit